jgi:hypothetical protein
LRENVLKIVLNEVKGQRTNIRTVYKIKLNRRTETGKQNSQSLLLYGGAINKKHKLFRKKKTNFFLEKKHKVFLEKKTQTFFGKKNTNFFWKKNKFFLKKKTQTFF